MSPWRHGMCRFPGYTPGWGFISLGSSGWERLLTSLLTHHPNEGVQHHGIIQVPIRGCPATTHDSGFQAFLTQASDPFSSTQAQGRLIPSLAPDFLILHFELQTPKRGVRNQAGKSSLLALARQKLPHTQEAFYYMSWQISLPGLKDI